MNLDSGSELSVNQRACPVPRREAEDPVYAHHSQPPEDPVYAYHWPPPETAWKNQEAGISILIVIYGNPQFAI